MVFKRWVSRYIDYIDAVKELYLRKMGAVVI